MQEVGSLFRVVEAGNLVSEDSIMMPASWEFYPVPVGSMGFVLHETSRNLPYDDFMFVFVLGRVGWLIHTGVEFV